MILLDWPPGKPDLRDLLPAHAGDPAAARAAAHVAAEYRTPEKWLGFPSGGRAWAVKGWS